MTGASIPSVSLDKGTEHSLLFVGTKLAVFLAFLEIQIPQSSLSGEGSYCLSLRGHQRDINVYI